MRQQAMLGGRGPLQRAVRPAAPAQAVRSAALTTPDASPEVALHRMASTADSSPSVAAQRAIAAALHDSPRVMQQRAIAQRMQIGDAGQGGTIGRQTASAATPPLQRLIGFEYADNGDEYESNREMSAVEVMAELATDHGVPPSQILKTTLDEFDMAGAIFSDYAELMQVLSVRGVIAQDESDDDEEADESGTTTFFHGTDLATAELLTGGVKIDARGKGELGGGFYMTHDLYQAAHIADYYTGKEERGPKWGVVAFGIPTAALQGPLSNRKIVTPEEFQAYYESVKSVSNVMESPYDWTIGPIKDKKTPYVQHLFASGGLALLNDKATTRQLVLSGDVGIDRSQYSEQVKGYDQYDDDTLEALLEMEPETVEADKESSDDDDADEVDYDYLDERVSSALKANKKKLTENVIAELEEALEIAPDDERLLGWLASLRK